MKILSFLIGDHKHPNNYVMESVGRADGFLLTAIHQAGLATPTPSPARFF